ncbi:DUF3800 domain-containing protein [Robbsia sp. Bb-Pol-6]|uniref:DUF3800 domain-containing protein n=1 Tax=Robbsia betulipollinis TaxID=2981849 RepID=A0ABT3ZUQ4_9BURK|nr:DUF3800 domain-containing protein [Robbsia betulipollinis]MCY0389955.1 DUF3800 domain-containing protein [Robbsia betulipollinis]
MYFYVDESGHTGPNLFDEVQPILYYGVLSSKINLDVIAAEKIKQIRQSLGVPRLHASDLGAAGLKGIVPQILPMIKAYDIRFDIYRVAKADHAIICFFNQVFDQGVNPAVTWTGYWTPLRYVLLLKVASLFNEELARLAWEARITPDDRVALPLMQEVCRRLGERVGRLDDARVRTLIGDALRWSEQNPKDIAYNVPNKKRMLDVTPNMIGFQFVMHGIAMRLGAAKRKASKVVVDQQTQFNKAQQALATYYRDNKDENFSLGPGLPMQDHTHIPDIPLEFVAGTDSCGLELVDIHLWIFKKYMENKLPDGVERLILAHARRTKTDEISLNALGKRWSTWFDQLPDLDQIPADVLERAREIASFDENRRQVAVSGMDNEKSGADAADTLCIADRATMAVDGRKNKRPDDGPCSSGEIRLT